jgi:hypothetical protein
MEKHTTLLERIKKRIELITFHFKKSNVSNIEIIKIESKYELLKAKKRWKRKNNSKPYNRQCPQIEVWSNENE